MINLKLVNGSMTAILEHSCPLPELSFVLMQGIEWLLGSGNWRWFVARKKLEDRGVEIVMTGMINPSNTHTLKVSHITQLGGLASMLSNRIRMFPKAIPPAEIWLPGGQLVAQDGQNRVFESQTGTFIQQYQLRPELTIGHLAFGLSDQIVGFFFKGAKSAKWQGSLDLAQLYFDYGMTREELARTVRDEKDYNELSTVAELP